jgi:pyruvate dehydrogenase (quinone)
MIRWEQMGFLGNPEFGVTFTPIDFAKFAEDCGGKGYVIKETSEVKPIIKQAMNERSKPTIVEAHIDPFEPLMPPKAEPDFIRKIAESFAKGQPYASRIGLTLYRNQIKHDSPALKSAQDKLKETFTQSQKS